MQSICLGTIKETWKYKKKLIINRFSITPIDCDVKENSSSKSNLKAFLDSSKPNKNEHSINRYSLHNQFTVVVHP